MPDYYIMGVSVWKINRWPPVCGTPEPAFFLMPMISTVQPISDKMKAGIPLTDEDRSDWLKEVQELASREGRLRAQSSPVRPLKEKYREQLGEESNCGELGVFGRDL